MQTHTLHTGTNTNINLTRADRIRNIRHSLQSTRTLPIQTSHSRRFREPSHERRSPEFSGSSTGWQHRSHGNVFNEFGINAAAADEALECANQQIGGGSVFETAFAALGEGRAKGGGYDDVIWILGGDVVGGGFGAGEVRGDLGEALLCWFQGC